MAMEGGSRQNIGRQIAVATPQATAVDKLSCSAAGLYRLMLITKQASKQASR